MPTKKPQPAKPKKPSVRVDITPELDRGIDAALAAENLRRTRLQKPALDRADFIRMVLQEKVDRMELAIQAAGEAAINARDKPAK